MSIAVQITATRLDIKLDELPRALRNRLREKLIVITNQLLAQVKAAEPRQTGRLQSMTRSFVDVRENWIRGRVRVLPADKRFAIGAAALEYGAPGRRRGGKVLVHAYSRGGVRAAKIASYTRRRPSITARRFLRGPAASILPQARAELEKALQEAIRDTMK
jgi:hypothetical protein